MIIVKLQGGLGNQLFQYAFARSVSSKLKTEYKLDKAPFDTYYTLHKYSLNNFIIKENLASGSDMYGFVWLRTKHKFFDTIYKYLRLKRKIMPFYYPEKTFHFDSDVFGKDGVYFDGFWQTEKYFKEISDEIRKEVVINKPLSDYSGEILKEIEKTDAISVHVRRADYVQDAATKIVWGSIGMDYYNKAISYMINKVESPHFFIFSDDYDWAVENFKSLPHPITVIKNGPDKNYEDLTLMSKCKHHIIANSSFSWWGAWLNTNKDKIVIGPTQWFNTKKKSTNTDDVLPPEWIKM